MKRGEKVYLDVSESRCEPSGSCRSKAGCARYLVAPQQGRPVADYSVQHTIYTAGWCAGYMDAAKHRDPPVTGDGPRVHDAPRGIFG